MMLLEADAYYHFGRRTWIELTSTPTINLPVGSTIYYKNGEKYGAVFCDAPNVYIIQQIDKRQLNYMEN